MLLFVVGVGRSLSFVVARCRAFSSVVVCYCRMVLVISVVVYRCRFLLFVVVC